MPTDSTALAAEMASHEPTSLAVASLMCAQVYNLDVVDTEIQDGEGLYRFLYTIDRMLMLYAYSKPNDIHLFQESIDQGKS